MIVPVSARTSATALISTVGIAIKMSLLSFTTLLPFAMLVQGDAAARGLPQIIRLNTPAVRDSPMLVDSSGICVVVGGWKTQEGRQRLPSRASRLVVPKDTRRHSLDRFDAYGFDLCCVAILSPYDGPCHNFFWTLFHLILSTVVEWMNL